MAITVTIEQENTVIESTPGEVLFQISFVITASEGLPLALFTYNATTGEFSHHATVYDLNAYPESQNDAINQGLDFYRSFEVTKQFENMTDAIQFAMITRSRLTALTSAQPLVESTFTGKEIYTLPLT